MFAANDEGHFYGLGQEQQDWFDRKGGTYELIHHNTKHNTFCTPYWVMDFHGTTLLRDTENLRKTVPSGSQTVLIR